MQGVKFNVDQNGKIISYTTETGGADTVFPFSDTSDATATAAHITVGQTAYVKGVKITGTRPAPVTTQSGNVGEVTVHQGTNNYYSGFVNFNTAFDSVPKVITEITSVRWSGGSSTHTEVVLTISNITRSGFNYKIVNDKTGENKYVKFKWSASA